jgi:hypothetical protein
MRRVQGTVDDLSHRFEDDYVLLGAPSGCDLETLRRFYRRAVREVHPDVNPALADVPEAQQRLRALNAAMQRLEEFQREHGHLPLQPENTAPEPAALGGAGLGAAASARERAAEEPARIGGLKWLLVSTTVALAIWALAPEPAKPPPPVPEGPTPTAQREAARLAVDEARRQARYATAFGVRIGDHADRVRAILGEPLLVTGEVWEYGPSHVIFRDGRVVDWYSSPLKPISVDEASRIAPADPR